MIPFFLRCRFRHIALQIQYDGSKYHGFASQESTETVENCLFDVLVKLKLIEDAKVSVFVSTLLDLPDIILELSIYQMWTHGQRSKCNGTGK